MLAKPSNRSRGFFNYSSLEDRRLLAGNVVVFENVHLYIRGDQADNQFELVVEDDQLLINGLEGTTINGNESYIVSSASVTDSAVSRRAWFAEEFTKQGQRTWQLSVSRSQRTHRIAIGFVSPRLYWFH